MKREISFRGRDINSGIWRIGHYVHDVCYQDSRATHRINGWEIDPNTVGEFTGLEDKHGAEAFEGDKVKTPYGIGAIIFHHGCFMLEWIDDKEASMELLAFEPDKYKYGRPRTDWEIVGNVFQLTPHSKTKS